LIRWIDRTERVEVTSPSGTQLSFNTEQRPFFTDTLVDWKEMKWMNLPTGEVIVAPVENSLEGTLVCDLAIGGVGPVNEPVKLVVKEGRVEEVTSRNTTTLKPIKEALNSDEWAKVVGEFAFGINPRARTSSEFLEAEKVLGTVHFAFGNNMDMPAGKNPSSTHTDFLLSAPTVKISRKDRETATVLTDGKFRSIQ
jgi:leucyl aminopeptidase (aminopeptidase T)